MTKHIELLAGFFVGGGGWLEGWALGEALGEDL